MLEPDSTFIPLMMRPSQPLALMRMLPTSMSTAKASTSRRLTAVRLHLQHMTRISLIASIICQSVQQALPDSKSGTTAADHTGSKHHLPQHLWFMPEVRLPMLQQGCWS